MPPSSSNGTCSVSRSSLSGSYSTTRRRPSPLASTRPRIGSGAGFGPAVLPGPWVFLTTGAAASSRRASDNCSSFFRFAVSLTPCSAAASATASMKRLKSRWGPSPTASAIRSTRSASGASRAPRQVSRKRARRSGDRSTASRNGRSTVTFQYPNASFGKIFDCPVSSNARKASQTRRMSSSDSSQFFCKRPGNGAIDAD